MGKSDRDGYLAARRGCHVTRTSAPLGLGRADDVLGRSRGSEDESRKAPERLHIGAAQASNRHADDVGVAARGDGIASQKRNMSTLSATVLVVGHTPAPS